MLEHVLRIEHQLAIGPDDLAGLGHHAQPVAVAIKGQADLAVGLGQTADQVLKIFGMRRIGMMVGEVAIDLGEKLGHFAAERLEELRRKRTGHAVAAVDRDLHRARELHITQNFREVLTSDIAFGDAHRCIGIELAGKRGVDD